MAITINGSGTITGVSVGGLPDGIVDTDMLATSAVTVPKIGYNGAVLQVVQTAKLDAFTSASTSFTDVTGLSVTITPVAASSKILVEASFVVANTAGGRSMYFNLVRGSTTIAQPSAGNTNDATIQCNTYDVNYNIRVAKIQFLDEPTYTLTDSITYKIQCKTDSGTLCVGRRGDRADELSISPITAMEISD